MQVLKENKIIIFILFVLIVEAVLFFIGNFKLEQDFQRKESEYKKIEKILSELDLDAISVSVQNLTLNKKIYGKNDNIPLPLASLVKTMTVIITLENYQVGEVVSVKEEAIREKGDFGLFANEKWRVEDLVKLTLLSSANDGIIALVKNKNEVLEKMNAKAKRLGMNHTYFLNLTGLDVNNKVGAVGSAEDMNILANFAILSYPEIFQATAFSEMELKSESGFIHKVLNTNVITNKIPNLIFSKTGFTEIAGGNLSIVFKNKTGHNIAVTLLGSTFESRFSDMEKIVNVLYDGSV